jgi:nucleoid-associated protein EbfC
MSSGKKVDLAELIAVGERIQRQALAAQEALARAEVTGMAGGGLVTVRLSGTGELKSIRIDPSVIDPSVLDRSAVADLEKLIVAAVRNAGEKARRLAEQKLGPISGIGLY